MTDPVRAIIYNGTKNTTDTEVTAANFGMDRRNVRTIIKLPASVDWDPSLPNNSSWTYNASDRTITQDVPRNNRANFFLDFTVKFNSTQSVNETTWTELDFPQTNYLINDNGTLDMSTERKSKVYKSYKYKKKLNIYKYIVMPE